MHPDGVHPQHRRALSLVALVFVVLTTLALNPGSTASADPDPMIPDVPQIVSTTTTVPEVVIEPQPKVPLSAVLAADRAAASTPTAEAAAAGVPVLHSLPTSTKKIYLDFDGAVVKDSGWSSTERSAATRLPTPFTAVAWSMDSTSDFSTAEIARIRQVWASVAEDYAPFNVDVTTEDPGTAGLDRSNNNDSSYGMRVLITDSDAWTTICANSRCGGVAFVDIFDRIASGTSFQPAWVFPQNFADVATTMADAISHEAGHTFGLHHDGTTGANATEYYAGQGAWAPIMGLSGSQPLSQWSKGEYANASNTEDDLAIIAANGAPLLADDAGDNASGAAAGLPAATRQIGTRADLDFYRLSACIGDVTITATPVAFAPDLDIELSLYDVTGNTLLIKNDPAATKTTDGTVGGLGASVRYSSVAARDYQVRVDGVGSGSASLTGYSDYASLGRYTMALSGTCSANVGVPSAPTAVAATGAATSATVTWAPPADAGSSAITGYRITASPGATVLTTDATGRSATFSGLARTTAYTFTVLATNGAGNGGVATATASTAASAPSAVTSLSATESGSNVAVGWGSSRDDGGSAIVGYRLRLDALVESVGANVSQVNVAGLAPGTHTATVTAFNSVGEGVPTSVSVVVPEPVLTSVVAGRTRTLRALIRPSLKGRAAVGTAITVVHGVWSRHPKLTYRWSDGTRVVSRSASYRPLEGQTGKRLTVWVTATAMGAKPVVVTLRSAAVKR